MIGRTKEKGGDNLNVDTTGLSDAIVKYRAKHNLNQSEFAQRCGLTTQTIGAVESGRHGITKLTKAKIMRVVESEE